MKRGKKGGIGGFPKKHRIIGKKFEGCYDLQTVRRTFSGASEAVFKVLNENRVNFEGTLAELSREIIRKLGWEG